MPLLNVILIHTYSVFLSMTYIKLVNKCIVNYSADHPKKFIFYIFGCLFPFVTLKHISKPKHKMNLMPVIALSR